MKLCIIGTGLIGGSMALALRNTGTVSCIYGVEADPDHARVALERKIVDEILILEEAIRRSDVVVISVPVDTTQYLITTVLDHVTNQVVFDVGSIKAPISGSVHNHIRRGRYVATHPMWGTENSGPLAALTASFKNKAAVICERERSDQDALNKVVHIYELLGMHLVYMDPLEHDLHVAYVSHISHITSFALANTVLLKEKEEDKIFELASGGFESTVRLAKSNPSMWVPVLLQNKKHILDVLEELQEQLGHFSTMLQANDSEGLKNLINSANKIRKILP